MLALSKRARGRGEMVGIGVAVEELECAPFIGARGGVVLVGSSEAREGAGGRTLEDVRQRDSLVVGGQGWRSRV